VIVTGRTAKVRGWVWAESELICFE
jgi:hypothetical protein